MVLHRVDTGVVVAVRSSATTTGSRSSSCAIRSVALRRNAFVITQRSLATSAPRQAPPPFGYSFGPGAYGGEERLPANTIIKFVPQQEAWIVERMGKFHRILQPGLAILAPFIDSIRYVHSLKEIATEVPPQRAITQDNVTLELTGILYYRIIDPYKASYGVQDPQYAISQLAQTTMRAEIGRMTLDKTLSQRIELNTNIVHAINSAAEDWGIRCLRYEICDIHPPENVVAAMHQQVSADRRRRAQVLDSLGVKESAINVAQGERESEILRSEAVRAQYINTAEGLAQATLIRAQAEAKSIEQISKAMETSGRSKDAVSLTVAQSYITAFGELAKKGNTLIVPADAADVSGMVGKIMASYGALAKTANATKIGEATATESDLDGEKKKLMSLEELKKSK